MAYRAEIFRDRFGLPHVVAGSTPDAYFGLGVAAVQDRGRRLLLHQAFLKGQLTELVGHVALPDPRLSFLDALARWDGIELDSVRLGARSAAAADEWSRSAQYWRLGEDGFRGLDERSVAIVTAYAAGVNWALRKAGETRQTYSPVAELAWWAWFEHVIGVTLFHQSNAFASRLHTDNGPVAVLGSDPHYWLGEGHGEAQIVCEADEFQLTGWWDGHVNLGFWGGANGSVAMGITASGVEGATIYRERLNEANDHYLDARSGRFEPLSGHTTHHGPVFHVDHERHQAISIRTPLVADMGRNLSQQLGIWRASSVADYLAIARESEYLRGHRVLIDRFGHIGYLSNGPIERRDERVDWTTVVDGSQPSGEPIAVSPDEREGWPIAVIDPEGGFISSANDPPWVATSRSQVPERYPKHMFGPGWNALGVRGSIQRRRLAGGAITDVGAAATLAFDVYVPRAHLGVGALRQAARPFGPGEGDADARELDELLARWDGTASPASVGMTVAATLHALLPEGLPAAVVRAEDSPRRRSEFAVAEPTEEDARAYWPTLRRVAATMRRHYGRLRQPWGEVHVFALNGAEIPAPGGLRDLESLFVSGPAWFPQKDCFEPDGRIRCVFGSRTVRVTEARSGKLTVNSVSVSGQSPVGTAWVQDHDRAQAALYSERRLKQVPTDADEIAAAARPDDHADCRHRSHEIVGDGA